MFDPTLEIMRLKENLRAKGMQDHMIATICDKALAEMNGAITDAVAEAMENAAAAGIEKGSDKFLNELKASRVGNSFHITTDSGQTDFSNPPYPMVPWLLKNPKVSKDGTLYKVIPVKGKSNPKGAKSITDIQKGINEARIEARNNGFAPGGDIFSGAATFSGNFAAQKSAQYNSRINNMIEQKNGKPSFRTVTSKTDAGKSWIQPARDENMTHVLTDINAQLSNKIEEAVMSVIRFYSESY